MRDDERVVVTGLGAVTPIGNTVADFWQNLTHGVSGASRITQFDPSALTVQIAAEVKDFDLTDYFDKKEANRHSKRAARFSQFSLACAQQALADAKLEITETNRWDVGVVVATGGGGVIETATETEAMITRGVDRVNPMFIPAMIANMAACQPSIAFGLNGPVI